MPPVGALRDYVAFQRRVKVPDGAGNFVSVWETVFERPAQFLMKPGSESVQAARLEGRQPVTVIVHYDDQTASVTNDWRLVDLRRENRVLEIKAADDMDSRRAWWTMVCEVSKTP